MSLGPYGPRVRDSSADSGSSDAKNSGIDSDRLSIAPMMAWTNRHFRYFCRLMTRHTKLYTEMLVDDTLIYQRHDLRRFLAFNDVEHPVVVQLGGSDEQKLAEAAGMAEEWGYDEINLNCGCPSKKVSKRCFGARLMLDPDRVKRITSAMRRRVQCPVTVKCRLGADDKDSYKELCNFVRTVSESGVTHFLLHARKCLLNGLSTSQNRNVPPLKYDWVHRLAADFPHLDFSINGHVKSLREVNDHLHQHISSADAKRTSVLVPQYKGLKGVMVGRAAFRSPWMFADADRAVFGCKSNPCSTKWDVIQKYINYCERVADCEGKQGREAHKLALELFKPLTYIFSGEHCVKAWKTSVHKMLQKEKNCDIRQVVETSAKALPDEVKYRPARPDQPVRENTSC